MHDFLTPAQAADQLGLSTRTLRRYASDGLLTRYTVGPRQVRYRANDVAALLVADD